MGPNPAACRWNQQLEPKQNISKLEMSGQSTLHFRECGNLGHAVPWPLSWIALGSHHKLLWHFWKGADWRTHAQNHLWHLLVDLDITLKYISGCLKTENWKSQPPLLWLCQHQPCVTGTRWSLCTLDHWSTWVPAECAINQGRTTTCQHLLTPHAHTNEKWELKLEAKCEECSWGSWGKETTQKWQRQADGQIHPCEHHYLRSSSYCCDHRLSFGDGGQIWL